MNQEAEGNVWTVRQRLVLIAQMAAVAVITVAGCVLVLLVGVRLFDLGKEGLLTHTTYGWTVIAKSGDGKVEVLVEDGSVRVTGNGIIGVFAERDSRTNTGKKAAHWKSGKVFGFIPLEFCQQGAGVVLRKASNKRGDDLPSLKYVSKAGDTGAFVGDYFCAAAKLHSVTR
jgi:hypothetical protein